MSPQPREKVFIALVYQSFTRLLGVKECIQIGSYPRYTAITPVHDLDILYVSGNWGGNKQDPSIVLHWLYCEIDRNYRNPTQYGIQISFQTHSITVAYLSDGEEVFSVDIVPAYAFSKNEFGDDVYMVPEILRKKHGKDRTEYYERIALERREAEWIRSDPLGYIRIASEIDRITKGEFRKTTKIIKKWKNNLADEDNNLKLKSFHLEQVITGYFQNKNSLEIFNAIFKFFVELPEMLENPNQIEDRANKGKFIDDYLAGLTGAQKARIKSARDGFLVKLENFKEGDSVDELLKIWFYPRKSNEQFLFDFNKKMLTDDRFMFKVDGFVNHLDGYRSGWIMETPHLRRGLTCYPGQERSIEFSVRVDNTSATEHLWKVRNSNDCIEPRGEITSNRTRNNPERTKYPGDHYVECYAIKGDECIARSRVSVRIL